MGLVTSTQGTRWDADDFFSFSTKLPHLDANTWIEI